MHTHPNSDDKFSMTDKASMTTYAGSALSAIWGVLTSQEFGILAGVIIGVAGLLVNYYFKARDDKYKQAEELRKNELHQVTLAQMQNNHQDNGS